MAGRLAPASKVAGGHNLPFLNWQTTPFLPTARSAVGLGITYLHFYSFYHINLAILTF
jgi:hypothetical protein